MAFKVICHPQLKESSVRTTTGLLGQVVGFLAAVEVWDNPPANSVHLTLETYFLCEVMLLVFCSGSVVV